MAAPWRPNRSATKVCNSLIGLCSCGFEIVAEQGCVERLGALVLLAHPRQPAAQLGQRLGAACLRRPQPGVEHQVGEIAIFLEAAKDRPYLADYELEHRYLLVQQLQDALLQGATADQVEYIHLTSLPNPVDAPDALLDRHRIPRHVEIDHSVAELDVAALTAGLGA